MRILYLSQYFPPEVGATQSRAIEMASNLVKLGHTVTVITEMPNHPQGITHPDYRGKFFLREWLDGIEVIRIWVYTSPKKTFATRMLFYLSYAVTATLAGIFSTRAGYDLIYASSPPLFVGGAGMLLSIFKRIPMVFEIRDLWPESAIELGELNNPTAIKLSTLFEESCYHRARKIITVTAGIRRKLVDRGFNAEKIHLIPNGANTKLFTYRDSGRREVRNQLALNSEFLILYAGIFGIAQGLETLVEAAKRLRSEQNIKFLLVGEGPTKTEITDLVHQYQLSNVILHPQVPRSDIPDYFSAADISIIPLRKIELFKGALPSKMFDSWACECPVLLCVDGEAREILEAANGGYYIQPEDAEVLAVAVARLYHDQSRLSEFGINGRRFTEQHYSREALAMKLTALLQSVTR